MSFSTSSRFRGPGSYLGAKGAEGPKGVDENSPARSNRRNTPLRQQLHKKQQGRKDAVQGDATPRTPARKPARRGPDGLPAFMMATASSQSKSGGSRENRSNSKRSGKKADGRFEWAKTGEGADMLMDLPMFGEDIKGTPTIRKEKHSRFSICDSMWRSDEDTKVDSLGMGHDEDVRYRNTGAGASKMSKSKRWGAGSFLEDCFRKEEDSPQTDYSSAHKPFMEDHVIGTGTSSFKGRPKKHRSSWLKDGTYLQDKALAESDGVHSLGSNMHSDFDAAAEQKACSFSRDKTPRFKDPELDPGSSWLGPESDAGADAPVRSVVVYPTKKNKHSRRSEFGTMFYESPQRS